MKLLLTLVAQHLKMRELLMVMAKGRLKTSYHLTSTNIVADCWKEEDAEKCGWYSELHIGEVSF